MNLQQEKFHNWLIQSKQLQKSSANKYAKQSHKKILTALGKDFFELDDMDDLRNLLVEVKAYEKSLKKDPKRMYSAGLNNYIKFLVETNASVNTLKDDFLYNLLIEESFSPQAPAEWVAEENARYKRNAIIGLDAIKAAEFSCQLNEKHQTFIARRSHKPYMEAHHLIPMAYQGLFEHGIDVVPNVACLCPNCHREIHFGLNTNRQQLIKQLHSKFRKGLVEAGIEIRLDELFDLYQIAK